MKKEELCDNISYLKKLLHKNLKKDNSNLKNEDVIYLSLVLNSMLNKFEIRSKN